MKKFLKVGCGSLVAIFVLLIVIGMIAGGGEETATPTPVTSTPAPVEDNTEEAPVAAEEPKAETPAPEPVKEKPSVPREYTNALKKAESYAATMHMSKAGIYAQLTSEYGENFPAEAAQYAIDNVEWDWKANALKKAESYAEQMAMSNAGIYDQLTSEYGEKFTPEEAQYAVDNLK